MNLKENRRAFIKNVALTTIGSTIAPKLFSRNNETSTNQKIGIIGLDTIHSVEFARMLNDPAAGPEMGGLKVVAAYPYGSRSIQSSIDMIAPHTAKIKEYGVTIVESIDELLKVSDLILLETNDGRTHLEQALPVFKAGKTMFIDKPIAASLTDTLSIFAAAEKYKVPIFSSSSLRYIDSVQEVIAGKIGDVTGVDIYTPAPIEKTHPDLFWYGIHGVEMLVAMLGPDIETVSVSSQPNTMLVTGIWNNNRIGTLRAIESGPYGFGGNAFGSKGIQPIGDFKTYLPLLLQIVPFFTSNKPPVKAEETIAVIAFMEAAQESKRLKGKEVKIANIMNTARKKMTIL